MRSAIYGAGSLGTILGAYITRAGEAIDLVNRNKAHVEALRTNGARVTGTVEFTQKVNVLFPDEMSGLYDIIFLMTKQQQNRQVVSMLGEHLADDGVIVTLQNGLPEPEIAEIVGEQRVIGCTVAWGATLLGPGVSELTSEPDSLSFSMGYVSAPAPGHATTPDQAPNHAAEVKALLEKMGTVVLDTNFIGSRWSKLLINASFSGMSAVCGSTFGEAAADRRSRRIIQGIIKECIDVCAKAGIRIEPVQGKDIVKLLDYKGPIKKFLSFVIIPIAIKKHALLKASMLQDLEKGKLTEVDSINGAVCAMGRKVGVPTPLNDKVVELVHAFEQGLKKPGFHNVAEF